jgi:hypothetical protein
MDEETDTDRDGANENVAPVRLCEADEENVDSREKLFLDIESVLVVSADRVTETVFWRVWVLIVPVADPVTVIGDRDLSREMEDVSDRDKECTFVVEPSECDTDAVP